MPDDDKPNLGTLAEALGGGPGNTESEDTVSKTKFQSDREAFDRLEKTYKAGDDEPAPKKAKKAAKPKKQTPEVAESQEPAPKVEAPKGEEAPELKKARDFLRLRASVPASVIEKLSAEEAIEWAASSSKNVSEVDRAFMERADLQKELRELREAANSGEPSSAVPAPKPLDLEEVQGQLSEQFGEEEAASLASVMKPLHERLAYLESVIDSAKASNAQHVTQTNRERLSEFVPLLAESDRAWEAVEREVIAQAEKNPRAFKDAAEFFDDAIKALYGADALDAPAKDESDEDDSADKEEEEREERKKATPLTKSKKPSLRRLPKKESDWQVFKHLEVSPGDIRGARQKGRVTA